jgi:hypothetical protein
VKVSVRIDDCQVSLNDLLPVFFLYVLITHIKVYLEKEYFSTYCLNFRNICLDLSNYERKVAQWGLFAGMQSYVWIFLS